MLRWYLSLGVLLVLSEGLWASDRGFRRDVWTVGRPALVGAVVGAGSGLVVWPVTKTPRSIAVGASVGLYLGLAYGLYELLSGENLGLRVEAEREAWGVARTERIRGETTTLFTGGLRAPVAYQLDL
jgi:hypothetical protein